MDKHSWHRQHQLFFYSCIHAFIHYWTHSICQTPLGVVSGEPLISRELRALDKPCSMSLEAGSPAHSYLAVNKPHCTMLWGMWGGQGSPTFLGMAIPHLLLLVSWSVYSKAAPFTFVLSQLPLDRQFWCTAQILTLQWAVYGWLGSLSTLWRMVSITYSVVEGLLMFTSLVSWIGYICRFSFFSNSLVSLGASRCGIPKPMASIQSS